MSLEKYYQSQLQKLRDQKLHRQPVIYTGVDFLSNDYLSLRNYEPYQKALTHKFQASSTGSGGSRYLSGLHSELVACEKALADFYNVAQVFLLPAGYVANIALYPALCGPHDLIFYDELCHASMKDGIRLSQAKGYPYRHLDFGGLKAKIERLRKPKSQVFIASESVFSMDGGILPLHEILTLCEKLDAWLILDEAHSVGLLSPQGRGLMQEDLSPRLLCVMAGFGKAFALQGGALLFRSEIAADYFLQKARPLIYSTAPSEFSCWQIRQAHAFFLEHQPRLKAELDATLVFFEHQAKQAGYQTRIAHPIHILKVNHREKALALAQFLRANQFAAKAIVPPTVRAGSERLRCVIHRNNSKDEITKFWGCINEFNLL